ncbi:PH domain-containing protein [Silanimonas lenta]|uniref:PH domain-containing protein n=1 Tax=Silanimonas lenta TaxID=265429 RepID=UPI000422FC70|nr:PH domain-containing protein [Silanimonas lenta]
MSPDTPPPLPDFGADWPGGPPWRPLPPEALSSFRLASLLGAGLLGLAAGTGAALLAATTLSWAAAAIAGPGTLLLALGLGWWRAGLAWRHTRWWLDGDGLRVRRGRFWRREVLVPRARVQHLDIERGPIERHLGLATLVVHTAGTRLNALRQPGLAEADAEALRDALVPGEREHDDEPAR